MFSKFISGAVLTGAVTAGIAGLGAPAMAATPSATHAVTHAAVPATAPAQAREWRGPHHHGYGGILAGRYYFGQGPYFNWGYPGFDDWWYLNNWRFAYGPGGYYVLPGAGFGLDWGPYGTIY